MDLELVFYPLALVYGVAMADCLVKGRLVVFVVLAGFAVYALATSPYFTFPGA